MGIFNFLTGGIVTPKEASDFAEKRQVEADVTLVSTSRRIARGIFDTLVTGPTRLVTAPMRSFANIWATLWAVIHDTSSRAEKLVTSVSRKIGGEDSSAKPHPAPAH